MDQNLNNCVPDVIGMAHTEIKIETKTIKNHSPFILNVFLKSFFIYQMS